MNNESSDEVQVGVDAVLLGQLAYGLNVNQHICTLQTIFFQVMGVKTSNLQNEFPFDFSRNSLLSG